MIQNNLINTDSNLKQVKVIKKRFLGKELPNIIFENKSYINFGIINHQFSKGKINIKMEFVKNDDKESYYRLGFINYLFCKKFNFPPNINNFGVICFKQYTKELFMDGRKLTIINSEIFNEKITDNENFTISFHIKNENNPNLILPTLNDFQEEKKLDVIYDKFINKESTIEFYFNDKKLIIKEDIYLIDGIFYPFISLYGNCKMNIYIKNEKKKRNFN